MASDANHRRLRFQLWGWVLFIMCAVLFMAASIRDGDILTGAASALFLGASVLFIVPVVTALKEDGADGGGD